MNNPPSSQPHSPPPRTAANPALQQLLRRKDVWRGHNSSAAGGGEVVASGHPALDQQLQGGGWPVGELVDVCQGNNGHGEWQLFGPALAQLSRQAGLILLLNPPALPYAPGLAQLGIDTRAIRVVRSRERQPLFAALVDSLSARCCLAVMAWEGDFNWRYAELRKLQLAASGNHHLCLCLRRDRPAQVQSPAPLRLRSQCTSQGLQVQLLKQRGQYQPRICNLPQASPWAPAHSDLLAPPQLPAKHPAGSSKVVQFKRPATQPYGRR